MAPPKRKSSPFFFASRTCVRYTNKTISPRDQLRVRVLQQDQSSGNEELIASIDAVHSRLGREHRELLRLIADADRRGVWRGSGARDMAHWLSMRQGISEWKARRWIAAAHALEALPGLSHAFASGDLGIDKVVELTRFATPQTEAGLLRWAQGVSCGAIRRRGDLVVRRAVEEEQDADRSRFLSWWYFDEGRRFGVEAELPAAQGAVVARALDRLADTLPVMPGEEDPSLVGSTTGRRPPGPVLSPHRLRPRPGPSHRGHPRPAGW